MTEEKVYHGSCLCKKVKFTIQGEPMHLTICHCRNCKVASGSAFTSNATFLRTQVTMTQGQDSVVEYADSDTWSGNTLTRSFCSTCGSKLFIKPQMRPTAILVHPGLIEETVTWVPKMERNDEYKWPWVKEITTLDAKEGV
ncbi:hypothetical protein CVT25_010039 [Psilocybe cyanescens]|uniref:CENP-V/GFA domain-containing protein n=1 Tax=Psilocybe cyanescens TaxID=93625 RepID=A0A409X3E8_PSICY|nr:hypothetical protein CVT25_010039 [Psilocybe cyanescens]